MSFLNTVSNIEDLQLALPNFFRGVVGDNLAKFRLKNIDNTELVGVVSDALLQLPWNAGLIVEIEITDFDNGTYQKKLIVTVSLTQIEVPLDSDKIEELEQIANLGHPDLFDEMEALIEDGIRVTVLEKIKNITSFSEPTLN